MYLYVQMSLALCGNKIGNLDHQLGKRNMDAQVMLMESLSWLTILKFVKSLARADIWKIIILI